MLQLVQFNFDRIGAITKDPASNTWSLTRRPLTYNMRQIRAFAKRDVQGTVIGAVAESTSALELPDPSPSLLIYNFTPC